jgi:uncharacterized protein YutE (UPF0331/DUF86 family)
MSALAGVARTGADKIPPCVYACLDLDAVEFRNALAHGDFTADNNIVWQTIQADLPLVWRQVVAIGGPQRGFQAVF